MADEKDELFGDGSDGNTEAGRPILTDKEIETARRIARERVHKAMKEAETERLIADEMEAIRREEGKRTGKVDLDEPVTFTIDCAEFSDRLRTNGEEFFHGYTYTKPRHVYDSLRETMFRGHVHQANLDGKDPLHSYRKQAAPALSGGEVA